MPVVIPSIAKLIRVRVRLETVASLGGCLRSFPASDRARVSSSQPVPPTHPSPLKKAAPRTAVATASATATPTPSPSAHSVGRHDANSVTHDAPRLASHHAYRTVRLGLTIRTSCVGTPDARARYHHRRLASQLLDPAASTTARLELAHNPPPHLHPHLHPHLRHIPHHRVRSTARAHPASLNAGRQNQAKTPTPRHPDTSVPQDSPAAYANRDWWAHVAVRG
ncbi:hypothetical protein C8F04DRAFT_1262591 [Mycena alexandri]|uniref:Uncharacterized protein n=1 Tax=Mycena alexandri TaxID=1745969 RepID=A0AAD6SPL7_9AGAR|nr:hypothetical protein C8F04DRAFT_1262591 [Mycena alexandri]